MHEFNFYTQWAISQQRQQEIAQRAEGAWQFSSTTRQSSIRQAVQALISKLEGLTYAQPAAITLDSGVCCPVTSG
jgi:hypothetical protein